MSSSPSTAWLRISLAVGVPLVSCIAAHVLFVPMWRTNDDPGINMLAYGVSFVDQPTPYLIFSNHLLGLLLNLLYDLVRLPWYRLLGLAIQVAAGAVLVHTALERRISSGKLLLLAVYFVAFDLVLLVRPHFTITSALAAQAAFLIWWSRVARSEPLRGVHLGLFCLLWVVSAAVRHQSAALILVLALPSVAVQLWRTMRRDGHSLLSALSSRELRAVALPWLGAGLIIASLHAYDRSRYAAAGGWDDYFDMYHATGQLLDFKRGTLGAEPVHERGPDGRWTWVGVRYAPELYEIAERAAGWSPNDYNMMLDWFYADREVYSAEKLDAIVADLPPASGQWRTTLHRARNDPYALSMLAVIGLALTFVSMRSSRAAQLCLTLLALAAGLLYLLFGLYRLQPWVYHPMLAFYCAAAIVMADDGPLRRETRWPRLVLRAAVALLLAALLVPAMSRLGQDSRLGAARNRALMNAVEELAPASDQLYVAWGIAFPLQWVRPLQDLERFRTLNFFSVGADTRSPFNRDQLKRFGIDDIYRGIYENPAVRVISDDRLNRMLVTYVEEHYGEAIAPVHVASFTDGDIAVFSVYRFVRVS